jgi:hypothetical protein
MLCMLTTKFRCLQEIPPSDPVQQGDEGDWDTVGELAGGNHSPAPTVEELVEQLTRHPQVAAGCTEPAVAVAEEPTATLLEKLLSVTFARDAAHFRHRMVCLI